MNETPVMVASSYSSCSVDPQLWGGVQNHAVLQEFGQDLLNDHLRRKQPAAAAAPLERKVSARIVKVFIADPNENIPLDKRVLYKGEEILTDLTDQELFYEVPIADLMAKHNDYRKTVVDKKQAEKFGRDIFLEPVRIRDLKMVVVTVASF